ncbi:MAG: hypothetical protein QNJ12_16185 [Ilumatobacter sp.]|uniref:hypothetical protein n=1 Tax=Ilumatobacter sp. TaxID=1967498 RepID=UPI002637C2AB|nr:hypothetical protein [Ilumatobacter sp.]MDJ0770338.1 hypothetical protein [Ilumatobacter sp.]
MANTSASEELLAAPVEELVEGLGLAVAVANAELSKSESGVIYTIPEAEVELKVAITINSAREAELGGGLKLSAFNVNASYKSTYSYSEEASSRIRLVLRAVPPEPGENPEPAAPKPSGS